MSHPISSLKLLNQLEEQVEKHIDLAIRVFQNLDEETLLRPSAQGGWSIAQCLWHLNSYGDYYFPLIQKGLNRKQETHASLFKSSWLGAYFTKMMQPDSKKKYTAFKNHTPPLEIDAYETVSEFIRQQEELLSLTRQAKKVDLNVIRIPISIASLVKLKLGDVFSFILAHDERHLQQAYRNTSFATEKSNQNHFL